MLAFRTEIRNTPNQQTIKIYLMDVALDKSIKKLLKTLDGVNNIEIQESLARNRVEENITIFRKKDVNINELKSNIDKILNDYFTIS